MTETKRHFKLTLDTQQLRPRSQHGCDHGKPAPILIKFRSLDGKVQVNLVHRPGSSYRSGRGQQSYQKNALAVEGINPAHRFLRQRTGGRHLDDGGRKTTDRLTALIYQKNVQDFFGVDAATMHEWLMALLWDRTLVIKEVATADAAGFDIAPVPPRPVMAKPLCADDHTHGEADMLVPVGDCTGQTSWKTVCKPCARGHFNKTKHVGVVFELSACFGRQWGHKPTDEL